MIIDVNVAFASRFPLFNTKKRKRRYAKKGKKGKKRKEKKRMLGGQFPDQGFLFISLSNCRMAASASILFSLTRSWGDAGFVAVDRRRVTLDWQASSSHCVRDCDVGRTVVDRL